MIRYDIIDRQRPGPQYQKKIIQITNFNQITETGLLYEKKFKPQISNKLQIVVRQGPRPLYEKVDGKAHR